MSNPVASILRAATRQPDEPLNILVCPTHERIESFIARTGHHFYAVRTPQVKDWNTRYAPVPENYFLLNPALGEKQIPTEVDFDLVLSQNKFGQFQLLSSLARQLHLPLVSLEHTLPHASWSSAQLSALKAMRGDVNVFISEFSREAWGWSAAEAYVVHHGLDTGVFSPNDLLVERKPQLLSVVNDWKNRDWCCGFRFWQEATQGLPVKVVGDTPGLSAPAASVPELVLRYRESQVFVNTSLVSPVPTALLEAMSCGCAVVSTATCMIPEIIRHGENGLLASSPAEMRQHCQDLLADPARCRAMGQAARATIVECFSLDRFVKDWDRLLRHAAGLVYTGVS